MEIGAVRALALLALAVHTASASLLRQGADPLKGPLNKFVPPNDDVPPDEILRQPTHLFAPTTGAPITVVPPSEVEEPNMENTECTSQEKANIVPLMKLEWNILGKVASGDTRAPQWPPIACGADQHSKQCYDSWGFTSAVSTCWEKEHLGTARNCNAVCDEAGRYDKFECSQCLGYMHEARQTCVHKAMRLSTRCQKCKMKAAHYYSTKCLMECRHTFKMGIVTASPACRKCNDVVFQVLEDCNAL